MEALILAAQQAGSTTPLGVTVAVGVAGAVATLLVAVGGALAKERSRRREMYANAVRALIGWAEYPYQIRRRTSDNVDELARLRDCGHDLQQDLEYFSSVLSADKPFLGDLYTDVAARIKRRTGPWIQQAWESQPVTDPEAMNLNGWGPHPPEAELRVLRQAIRNRFGWKRLAAALHLRQPQLPPEPAEGRPG